MLKSIRFTNYKAFGSGRLKIRPIMILLGANSSGKSSLMQLFLLLKQTFCHAERYASALKLNGPYVNLGEDENLIKDKKPSNVLKLEFQFDVTRFKTELKELRRELYRDIFDLYERLSRLEELSDGNRAPFLRGQLKMRPMSLNIDEDKYVKNIEPMLNYIEAIKTRLPEYEQKFSLQKPLQFSQILLMQKYGSAKKFNVEGYREALRFLNTIINDRFRFGCVGYEFKHSKKERKLAIRRQYLKSNKNMILDIHPNRDRTVLSSGILTQKSLSELQAKFNTNFSYNLLGLKQNISGQNNKRMIAHHWGYRKSDPDVLLNTSVRVINTAYRQIKRFFAADTIHYVGPLRAFPQRYYLLDESNIDGSINYLSGKSLAETLKKNDAVIARINGWLAKFGLSISVKEFKDIIHNILVKQSGLDLNITDVGFGISQVLPILMQGFMSEPHSLTLIEQPEIHLHPNMQAELGDLFADIIHARRQEAESSNKDVRPEKRLLIETHSEYLIKRLRRRISEGKLKSGDIGLCFIEPRTPENNSAVLKEIPIEKNGAFEWPRDFYITGYNDDMEFFKNMAKTDLA